MLFRKQQNKKINHAHFADKNQCCSRSNTLNAATRAPIRRTWIVDKILFYGVVSGIGPTMTRVFTPIKLKVRKSVKLFMMDVITGSLYDIRTGRCLTSTYLTLVSATHSKNKAAEYLLNLRVDDRRFAG